MAKPKVPKTASDNRVVKRAVESTSDEILVASTNGNGGVRKTVRKKATIVKSDLRANLVPINLENEIRRLAYLMAERRGFEPGHEADDWLAAEREVQQRYHHQSA